MEIWDLYNKNRELIGEHVRGTELPKDGYHPVVHIWIRNSEGKYLMTQRSVKKKTFPLAWECVGGAVLKGEQSLPAALREVQEEVGIVLEERNGRKVLTQIREFAEDGTRVNDINDIFLFEYDGPIQLSEASTDEVAEAKWMTREEIEALYHSGQMVRVIKDLSYFIRNEEGIFGIQIRRMTREDIPAICKADNDETESFVSYLNRQLDFQENGECAALLALFDGKAAGYVFLFYECRWGALKDQGLPGICDLVVFEPYRRKRIATRLMDSAEALARRVNTKIYLDVCLNAEYGPAQRFYALRGYVPDGAGVYYEERVLGKDEACKNDDELTLCLVKELG